MYSSIYGNSINMYFGQAETLSLYLYPKRKDFVILSLKVALSFSQHICVPDTYLPSFGNQKSGHLHHSGRASAEGTSCLCVSVF